MSRRRKKVAGNNGYWSETQKIGAVTTYLASGNLSLTSVATEIPLATLNRWKVSPWWKQLTEDIRAEENLHLDAKLAKVVNKSVDQLLDRVERGDFQYDQRTGHMVRVPIKARDAAKITTDMIDRRQLLQGAKVDKADSTKKIEDRLLRLADEFSRFAKSKVVQNEPLTIEMVS
jgi:hypothetical protein